MLTTVSNKDVGSSGFSAKAKRTIINRLLDIYNTSVSLDACATSCGQVGLEEGPKALASAVRDFVLKTMYIVNRIDDDLNTNVSNSAEELLESVDEFNFLCEKRGVDVKNALLPLKSSIHALLTELRQAAA